MSTCMELRLWMFGSGYFGVSVGMLSGVVFKCDLHVIG